jgi:hypothetical protein
LYEMVQPDIACEDRIRSLFGVIDKHPRSRTAASLLNKKSEIMKRRFKRSIVVWQLNRHHISRNYQA